MKLDIQLLLVLSLALNEDRQPSRAWDVGEGLACVRTSFYPVAGDFE